MKILENYDVKIFTDNYEDGVIEQLYDLLGISVFKDSKIRLMPDCHKGAGCVIGFTGNLGSRIIPNVIGVDQGCGMNVTLLGPLENPDWSKLDNTIRKFIPSGMKIREDINYIDRYFHSDYLKSKELINSLLCYRDLKNPNDQYRAVGTLGGGNHFIEIDKDQDDNYYLVIHTGSRNIGKQTSEYYQKKAIRVHQGWNKLMEEQNRLIQDLKSKGLRKEIQKEIQKLHASWKAEDLRIPKDLCYLSDQDCQDYLHDLRINQSWAVLNRNLIKKVILKEMSWPELDNFETIHNYIDDTGMVRKGAVSARSGERLIIPINMRDGSLICRGLGNPDWNESAPHGAGRIMSRTKAFETLNLQDYQDSMSGIFTTSVNQETLDEAPMVYKSMSEIIENTKDTVEIESIIKPVYNFKASEEIKKRD